MTKNHRRLLAATVFAVAVPMAACAQQGPAQIGVELISDDFEQPVLVTSPAGDDRLFVVDQAGQIWIVQDGAKLEQPFLDLGNDVAFGGEQGLLGLAFHPDYASNGRFFINYTDPAGDQNVAEYRVSADANVADPESRISLIHIDDRRGNHNGGWLAFGPDGYLYISNGDGGGGGDPDRNGQNPNGLFAKLLRIDVDNGSPYAIPPTNPFANGGGAPEAFVIGLRNPWRVAFDGDLIFIADVGQGEWEEVDVITTADAGANFGWNVMEGAHCYNAANCNDTGFVAPVYEYSHREGCSITGGYVYRGAAIPAIDGHYFFADYCEGFVRSFRYVDGAAADVTDWSRQIGNIGNITSFGVDSAGELYITVESGGVYKIVPAA